MKLKLSLVLLILSSATGSPAPYSQEPDGGDYDYEGGQEAGLQGDQDHDQDVRVYETPEFVTKPQTLLVNEGDTIRLPCFVNRLEGFVMLWKRGRDIITVGNQIVDKEVRLEETSNGNSLVIGPASPADEADYTCQISSYKPSEIVHSVKVRVKPVVTLSPAGSVLVVTEGEPATITCSVLAGSPAPQLSWSRRHGELPAGAAVQQTAGGASVLRFAETTRHHAGHYSCSADNGFGPEPSTQEVKLTVHHAPAVEPLPAAVYTGLGRREEVVCVVHSSPRAEVTWTKDGQPLDSRAETSQEGPRHTLALHLTERAMFGQYSCHAHNQLGSAQASVAITGLASPPVFSSDKVSLYPDSYTLAWAADSKTEITSFRVLYKETKSEQWLEQEVAPRQTAARLDDNGAGRWEGTALLSHLSPATQYEARVLPENIFGLTQPDTVFNFATKGAVPYHQPSTSAAGPSLQMMTGLVTLLGLVCTLVR